MAVTEHPPEARSTHGVDTTFGDADKEPSADWGWHGSFPRAGKAAGWFTAFALFAMLIGNHESHIEDVYLVVLGTVLVVMLIASHLKAHQRKRRSRD